MNLSKALNSFGTLSLINFARKHAERLAQHGSAEISAKAATITAAADDLESAYTARRPLVTLWSRATDAKDAADDALDAAIAALSYELLGPAQLKGDRSAPEYRVLFPEGNIGFIHGPDRAELAHVSGMVAYLKANAEHPMASRAAELETKAAALDGALPPLAAAEAALRAAQTVERAQREALVRAVRKSAALLRAELMDEKKVDALFPRVADAKVAEDETPETATHVTER